MLNYPQSKPLLFENQQTLGAAREGPQRAASPSSDRVYQVASKRGSLEVDILGWRFNPVNFRRENNQSTIPYRGEIVKRFRGGLVFKAHRLLYRSTLGSKVVKKKENPTLPRQKQEYLVPPERNLDARYLVLGCEFRVWGEGFWVQGSGCRV